VDAPVHRGSPDRRIGHCLLAAAQLAQMQEASLLQQLVQLVMLPEFELIEQLLPELQLVQQLPVRLEQ
jgi:hypothetical protein